MSLADGVSYVTALNVNMYSLNRMSVVLKHLCSIRYHLYVV